MELWNDLDDSRRRGTPHVSVGSIATEPFSASADQCPLDAESKLAVSWYVGGRDSEAAMIFMDDLAKPREKPGRSPVRRPKRKAKA